MTHVKIGAIPNIKYYANSAKDTIPHCECCTFHCATHNTVYMLDFICFAIHTHLLLTLYTTHTVLSYMCFTILHMSHCAYCAYGAAHNWIYIFHFMQWTIHFILSPCIYTHMHSKLCTPCYTRISLSISIYIYHLVFSLHTIQTFLHTPCFTF